MGSKLEFKVVQASGSDADFPADELNRHSPHTRGWQSARFCEYPQEVILELRQRSVIRQVQLLSHQHKIATRVELFVGAGARGPEAATWTRLGYLSLDSNERSDFQARELKSVYVECRGRFLKLVVHRCHINRANLFNQVGVVAVNLLGEYQGSSSSSALEDEGPPEVVEPSAAAVGPGARREPAEVDDLAFDMNVDPRAARQVRALLAAKEAAVAAEDYDAAKRLKAAERDLGNLGSQLAQLEVAKRRAVRDEDYDRAKLLKAEITALRRRVDDALRACDIDAIANGGNNASGDPRPPDTERLPSPGLSHRASRPIAPPLTDDHLGDVASPERSFRESFDDGAQHPPGMQTPVGAPPSRPMTSEDPFHHGHGHGGPPASPLVVDAPMMGSVMLPSPSPPPMHQDNGASLNNNKSSNHRRRSSFEESVGDDAAPPADDFELDEEDDHLGGSRAGAGAGVAAAAEEEDGRVALAGVPNAEDLPVPEALLAPPSIEPSEVSGVVDLLGDYRARCLFSKNWALREAAMCKARLMVEAGDWDEGGALLDRVCDVIRLGVSDKISQVYLTAVTLLEALCASRLVKGRKALQPLEPTIRVLLAKLGENQPKQREAALEALASHLARSKAIGANAVAHAAIKSLDAKKHTQHNRWRPVASRLILLNRIITEAPLPVEPIMAFVESHNCASHTFEEVRNAARELLVSVYLRQKADSTVLEPYLEKLRPKQVEEYRTAFLKAAQEGGLQPISARRPSNHFPHDADDDGGAAPPLDDHHSHPAARDANHMSNNNNNHHPRSHAKAPRQRASPAKGPAPKNKRTPNRPSPAHHESHDGSVVDDLSAGPPMHDDEDQLSEADPEEERFRDQIMKQLEDKAFSVHEAYEILQEHFGSANESDSVKDNVLLEWVSEIGDADAHDLDPAKPEHRNKMLMQVATWLFQ